MWPEPRNGSQSVAVITGINEMFENMSENVMDDVTGDDTLLHQDTSSVSNSIDIEIAEEMEEMDHERNIPMVTIDSNRCVNREDDQSGIGLLLWLLIGALLFLLSLLVYNLWLGSRQSYTGYIDPTYHLQY